jgi:hypothetical protein
VYAASVFEGSYELTIGCMQAALSREQEVDFYAVSGHFIGQSEGRDAILKPANDEQDAH